MSEGPFWQRLFAPGGFEWAFKMRKGDAAQFFAPQDPSGALLGQRKERLDAHPDRYTGVTELGQPLVEQAWGLALDLGQVGAVPAAERDLLSLSRQWEADLLMMERETMTVAAGAVCFPSSWELGHAIGKTLDQVHGVVPRLNPQIGVMIQRFLEKITPGKSFCRENWSFTRTDDLDYHPAVGRPRLDHTLTLDEVFLRIEHQLFTGIPGGVLMGIRIKTFPLREMAADPEVWRITAEKLRTMPADVADYKSMAAGIPRILEVMDEHQAL